MFYMYKKTANTLGKIGISFEISENNQIKKMSNMILENIIYDEGTRALIFEGKNENNEAISYKIPHNINNVIYYDGVALNWSDASKKAYSGIFHKLDNDIKTVVLSR